MSIKIIVLETCVRHGDLWTVKSQKNEDTNLEEENDLKRRIGGVGNTKIVRENKV